MKKREPNTVTKALHNYYRDLSGFAEQSVTHETAVRSAFQTLLEDTARANGWILIPELGKTGVRRVIPDGTVRDMNNLPRGYWEAKDTRDNLDVEISKKIALGYPLNNIIFEDTREGVLAFLVSPSIAQRAEFTKIVIKASTSTARRGSRLQILPNGDLIGDSIPILELISLACDVPDNPSSRLSALPEWTARQRFDIEAKVPVSLKLDSKDTETQKQTMQPFIRALLADHFALVLRARAERMPVYALVAKGVPKLSKAAITSSDCILDTGPQGCHGFAPGFGHP